MISEHVLLPNTHHSSQFRDGELANIPLVAVFGIKVHVIKLENHGEFTSILSNVLTGLEFGYSARHFANGAAVVQTKSFSVDLIDVLVNI